MRQELDRSGSAIRPYLRLVNLTLGLRHAPLDRFDLHGTPQSSSSGCHRSAG
jgi:hypothetical protein